MAKETRPDLACAASFAQTKQKNPTIGDVEEVNRAVKQAIPLTEMNLVVYHDAAWGNAELAEDDGEDYEGHKVGSQIGCLVMAVHRDGAHAKRASVLAWRSHACRRVCRLTFAGETMACCEGLEAAIHLRAVMLCMTLRRLVAEDEAARMIPIHAVTDCRSLFDYVHRCGAPKATADRRLVMDLADVRQRGKRALASATRARAASSGR